MSTVAPVLRLEGLRVEYDTPRGRLAAVDGIDLTVGRGEIVGLIGESGSGKTTAAMACLRLVQPPGRVTAGKVILEGKTDLLGVGERALRDLRWRKLALIPQGALNSLNPVMRVKDQIGDTIRAHESGRIGGSKLQVRVERLFKLVGLPARCYRMYPHELSGGMKQRVCIAMAIALEPPFIIADEPTSALDVIVQRVVAQTLLDIKERLGISLLLIGHDIGLMAQLADRVAVMYAGKIVEIGPSAQVFAEPRHPYTRVLIGSVPSLRHKGTLHVPGGLAPDLFDRPTGCIFQSRCPEVFNACRVVEPPLIEVGEQRSAACLLNESTRESGLEVTSP